MEKNCSPLKLKFFNKVFRVQVGVVMMWRDSNKVEYVSYQDYLACSKRLMDLHPVGFYIETTKVGNAIYRRYLFEDMTEWLTKEYELVINGVKHTCIEYCDNLNGCVCIAIK